MVCPGISGKFGITSVTGKQNTFIFSENEDAVITVRAGNVLAQDLLIAQVTHGVRMEQTIQLLESAGVERVIEIGPGRVLSGVIKRTARSIGSSYIDTAEDLEKICQNRF